MSNVLFVEKKLATEKQGLMYLSAVLKARGHRADVVQADEEDVHGAVENFRPDFFAYSVCTGEHRFALEINRELKRRYNKPSVFGGPHPTFFPEVADEPGVDFVVIGQGEEAIVDIVEGKTTQRVVKKPLIADLSTLPMPDREIIYKYPEHRGNPMKNVITQRDCPYGCTYCHNHLTRLLFADERGKMFQRKTVDNTIAEIQDTRQRFGLEIVLFIDDNFIGLGKKDERWIEEFSKKYGEKVALPFVCCVRANRVDEDVVRDLYHAGLRRVHFSLESADPDVQKNLLKRGQITNDDVRRAVGLFKKYGVWCRMQNMIGLPVENPLQDALNTLWFNMKCDVDDSWVTLYQPYPRTRLGEYCKEKGFVRGELADCCAASYFDESRLELPDKERIERLHKWWPLITKYRLPRELVYDLMEIPLSDEAKKKMIELKVRSAREQFRALRI